MECACDYYSVSCVEWLRVRYHSMRRRSQGDQKGHALPKFLENIVILCLKRPFKQKCYSPKIKHFGPPKIFRLAAPLIEWYLFGCCSASRVCSSTGIELCINWSGDRSQFVCQVT